jgi:flagellin
MNVNNMFQSKTIAQLTSGYRINQAGDDAAGLAVANQFSSGIAELTQGVANGNDGVAQLQIMDGGMSNISQILDRLQTLATQSASGTFTGLRSTLNTEFQNDLSEIDRQSQSIGLNAGGTFAQNLNVYLGEGSGSQSLSNGIVTLNLAGSAVDSQSLGLKGMEAVNLTSGSLSGTNAGTDLGASSATSVQNIVGNTTGGNANQEANAGYASFQFSGAGFSDAGQITASVNLAGVTDTTTLAAAVNAAIKSAGLGTTAAATAFQSANIVASVHTDTAGGQELAFSSSTSAFQVQAGDQMANALLGNVSNVGTVNAPIAQGFAVASTAATTVTGANTSTGTGFTAGQAVSLVVTGGGLASPVTLKVNTTGAVGTSAAIADLENQFTGNAALQAAGLSMTGSTTTGTPLSFTTADGEGFNVQVTGDTAGLLGLGSFAAGNTGQAAYSTSTAAAAYSAAAVTGTPTTVGLASGMEISVNGAASTALTAIDLTTGAHAVAASATSSAAIGVGGAVDITAANQNLDITVTNNGTATNQVFALAANQVATAGVALSNIGTLAKGAGDTLTVNGVTSSSIIVAAADHNNQFTASVNGGASQIVTVADGTYASAAGFLGAISGLPAGLTATWGATGALTLTSGTTGAASTVAIGAAVQATSAVVASTTVTKASIASTFTTIATTATTDSFKVALNGGVATTVAVADAPYTVAATFLGAVQTGLNNALGTGTVVAGWDAITGDLTLTSAATGSGSSIVISALGGNTGNLNFGLGTLSNTGSNAFANTGLGAFGLSAATTTGLADQPTTVQAIATAIQGHFVGTALVTVNNNNTISIASTTKGANSSVAINTPATFSANGTLNLTAPVAVLGQNSSIADIVNNLNAQFAASSTWEKAGLQASQTGALGVNGVGYITIASSNQTQFRLDALGAGAAAAENIGFGVAGTTFAGAIPSSTGTSMSAQAAFGVSNSGPQTFAALAYGNDKQALTFSATDSSGMLETKTITLQNNAATNQAGANIDSAVAYINQQLQQSTGNPALQQIVAVKQNVGAVNGVGGTEEINFVSSLSNFTVGVAGTANADGVHGGVATQVSSTSNGSGANMSIDTQTNAEAAVAAVTTAVAKLGTAQAAVGIGENQLNYAINLASSQITNFSAAESQIRDADVAQQAANLTKAQVLQQAAIAAMAQANSSPQAVLKLLQT